MPDDKAASGPVDDGLNGLTYKVIGLEMAVHNELGPGHRETTYHNAMTQKYVDAELTAEFEPELPVLDGNGNRVSTLTSTDRSEFGKLIR